MFIITSGVAKLADGKALGDPDVLRRLTSSVSSALDEAAAALTRMRTQNNGVPSSPNHTAEAGKIYRPIAQRLFSIRGLNYDSKALEEVNNISLTWIFLSQQLSLLFTNIFLDTFPLIQPGFNINIVFSFLVY